jgi:hypothetical protein
MTTRPWKHEFARDEFRNICTMLQSGRFVDLTKQMGEHYLVIELVDGRRAILNWRGDTFEYFDHYWVWWRWPVAGLAVSAPRLAEYLREYLPELGEAANGESSN